MTGNLVLRRAEVSDPTHARGKLAPNWKGSYRVISIVRDGTYTLATMEGKHCREPDTSNLKKL
ncbi:hypothetical protein BHE74_00052699 [Ensete ventricosum]|nr:hypothetical protein BHE74_00052699 [Ensete ventricosum]